MSLVCAISGVPPEEPVYSPTGYIFEKRLIEKHLKTAEKCPITGEDLSLTDLLPVRVSKIAKPRPVTATTLPGLLSLFQNEWDSTMAETFTLRQHVEQVRSQLSHTLYQHDASCRVIARLLRERNAAQTRVTQLQERLNAAESAAAAGRGIDVESGLPDEVLVDVVRLAAELPPKRKQRNPAPPYSTEKYQSMTCVGSYPLHQTTTPGVTCCAVDPKAGSSLVCTGGADGFVVVFDAKQKRTRTRLAGHMKRVNRIRMHPTEKFILSASDDKTTRIWREIDADTLDHTCAHVVRKHVAPVVDIAVHPVGSFFATCGKDLSWALTDIVSGRTLYTHQDLPYNYRCIQFHPDGAFLGAGGEDGTFQIWDIKSKKKPTDMASLSDHQSSITSISFSENGFHVATASEDATIRLWDLRRSLVFQTLTPNGGDASAPFQAVAFDHSANFIAGASDNVISLYYMAGKSSTAEAGCLTGHTGPITDVCFGKDASFLLSTSMDRTVKLWEPAQVDEAMEEEPEEEEDDDDQVNGK